MSGPREILDPLYLLKQDRGIGFEVIEMKFF